MKIRDQQDYRKIRGLQRIRLTSKLLLKKNWGTRKRKSSCSPIRKRQKIRIQPPLVLMLLLWKCKRYKYLLLGVFFIIYSLAVFLPVSETDEVKACSDCGKVLRSEELLGWEKNKSRDIRVYVAPGNNTLILNNNLCKENVDLMIMICSAPENFVERTAIRETWGKHNFSKFQIGFLLGKSLNASTQFLVKHESQLFHDIIQQDFEDSYKNLTIKSIMMLKWFLKYCQSARYLMKTDDDMYINVTNLATVVDSIHSPYVLFGSMIYDAKPVANPKHKWYVPEYMYPYDVYPNYISGTAYVMSKKVAIKLYLASMTTPLLHIEDVYVTGICASKAGIIRKHHKSFSYEYFGPDCLPHHMVTSHKIPPNELYSIWNNRDNCSVYRKPPYTKSYLY